MIEDRTVKRWWDEADRTEAVTSLFHKLREDQNGRHLKNIRHAALYMNKRGARSMQDIAGGNNSREAPLTLNISQSIVDTVVSKITKNRAKPMFLTDGGDYAQRNRAKMLGKAVTGIFYQSKFYEALETAFRDACIFDAGVVKFYTDDDQIKCERVFPGEIFVDDYDATHGKPRTLIQHKPLPRQVLIGLYPKHRAMIEMANPAEYRESPTLDSADQVDVVEGWHIGDEKTKGRHIIAIDGCKEPLLDEEWEKDYHPFLRVTWSEPLKGWWGQGLVEQLEGLQLYISSTMRDMQRYSAIAVPKIFVSRGAKIVKSHLHNYGPLTLVEYDNQMPVESAPNMASLQWYLEQIKWAVGEAYRIAGISQLSAQGLKPAGLNSGAAMRTHHDIETERFATNEKSYERKPLEAAHIVIDMAKDLDAELEGGFSVAAHDSKSMERIKWADVDMERDAYVMQVFPTSFLRDTPEGKLADIQELIQSGMLPREEAFSLLDYPDLNAVSSYLNAPSEMIKHIIDDMIENGNNHQVEPFVNFELAVRMMSLAYVRAKTGGVPEDRLDLLRTFITTAQAKLKEMQAPEQQPPPAPPQGGMPMEQPPMPMAA